MIVETIAFEVFPIVSAITFENSNIKGPCSNNVVNFAIRGFHYSRRYWSPEKAEDLIYLHRENNAFDLFAIKTCKEDGIIVGHLPHGLTLKFILDRGFWLFSHRLTTENPHWFKAGWKFLAK